MVVHYTAKGSEETAEEIDHVGEGGLKTTEGTVTHLDRGAKTVTIKTADGTEQAFRLTDHAAEDAGKDISEGAEKSGKVTVYYTERSRSQGRSLFQQDTLTRMTQHTKSWGSKTYFKRVEPCRFN